MHGVPLRIEHRQGCVEEQFARDVRDIVAADVESYEGDQVAKLFGNLLDHVIGRPELYQALQLAQLRGQRLKLVRGGIEHRKGQAVAEGWWQLFQPVVMQYEGVEAE